MKSIEEAKRQREGVRSGLPTTRSSAGLSKDSLLRLDESEQPNLVGLGSLVGMALPRLDVLACQRPCPSSGAEDSTNGRLPSMWKSDEVGEGDLQGLFTVGNAFDTSAATLR